MVEALIAVGAILIFALLMAVRRAKRRQGSNPNDIYPHW
jgi:hypothetical protein